MTTRGRRLRAAHVPRIVLEAGRRAKLGVTLPPHMLWHSAATHLLARGASIRHVQELSGHASINTTEIYTHLAVGDLAKVHGKAHPLGNVP